MKRKRTWLMGLALVSVLGLLVGFAPLSEVRAQDGPNLLTNGDMESECGQAWPFQDGIPEVQVAPGWRGFWIDNPPPDYAVRPEWCEEDPGCVYWGRPEFRGIMPWQDALRVHAGNCAQKLHSFARQMEAGLYQQVSGIAPNTRLRFQAYVQTWSCMGGERWNVCPTAPLSNSPAPMHVRVGIDPTGGTNPWAGTVVWSGEGNAWDIWTPFQVEAVAQASTVTVFVYHRTDWVDAIYRPNNDVYIDTASLVAVGQGAAPTQPAAQPVAPAPVVPVVPRATSTPRPDGAIVHVVQSGDTVMGIAIQYGVSVDQILQLNAGSIGAGNMIWPGQELVISIPAGAVAPVVPSVPLTTTVTPAAVAMTGASICIVAFNDRNGDTFREPDSEEMLPNAAFILGESSRGVVGQYTSDGLSEPYCFENLNAGTYRIVMQPPTGYANSGPSEMMLGLGGGSRLDVALGAQRSEQPAEAAGEGTTGTDEPAERSAAGSQVLRWVARIGGIAMLLAAAGMAVFFVISRRRG